MLIFSLITGCSSSSPDISEDLNYNVGFTVVDENEDPIEGAVVTLDGVSKTTDENGLVIFSKFNGTYNYLVTADEYNDSSDTVVVDGDNITIDVTLEIPAAPVYNVGFTVVDENEDPIEGAVVTLDGVSKTTDENGLVIFSKFNGTYNYLVTADGYNDSSDTVVVDGDNITIDVTLEIPAAPVYNVSFKVVDASKNPIEGAVVSLDSISENTDTNGQITFQKENGSYSYSVSKTGYVEVNDSVEINDSDEFLDITLYIAPPEGYTGIYSWSDLDAVRDGMTAQDKYILMNDLDSTTPGYDTYASSSANSGEGWQPIGDYENDFRGTFDGNGFTIHDLKINRDSKEDIGLFGAGYEAKLVNIKIDSADINGKKAVGSITGNIRKGEIDNCSVTGSVNGNTNTGGIAGYSDEDSIIKNSSFSGQITGIQDNMSSIGGIVGHNFGQLNLNSTDVTILADGFCTDIGGIAGYNYGSITNCNSEGTMTITSTSGYNYGGLVGQNYAIINNSYSIVNVTGNDKVGGLVGLNQSGSINQSYSTGTVSGNSWIGGLIGYNRGNVSTTYSTSEVIGTGIIGGLIGMNEYSGEIEDCYSTGDPTGDGNIGGLVGTNYGSINSSYSIGIPSGSSSVGGLVGSNDGNITDSMSLQSISYEIVGYSGGNQTESGRVTEAPESDMQDINLYLQVEDFKTYGDLISPWDIYYAASSYIWTINGTENDGYPILTWQLND